MNLTEFAIKRSRVAISIFICIAAAGVFSYFSLPKDSMPPFTVRVAKIIAPFPGAGPDRVENLVSRKIEEKIQEIPELKEVTSESRSGLSVTTVTLKDEVPGTEMQAIWDRIRRKLDATQFPQGVRYILKDEEVGVVYGILLGLVADEDTNGNMEFSYAEMKKIAEGIRDELITLNDAARVEIGGNQTEQIFVEFDNAKMSSLNITAAQIQQILSGTNILFSGGELNIGNERLVIEPTGNFNNVDDIKNTIVRSTNGQSLLLQDIATITRGYQSPETAITKVDNKRAIAIAINLKEGSSIVSLGEAVDEKLEVIKAGLPAGLKLKRLASLDTFVDSQVTNFVSNLLQTVGLVLVVMLVFLGFRTGLVIASLVPMVILATFLFMNLLGTGINQVSLAALIMALGLMVDNGVVVAETILVKLEQGLDKMRAVKEACDELIVPLLISTLTTSAAFLSFFLSEGGMGDMTGALFIVITIALVSSWVLSMTMVTLLSYYFLKVEKAGKKSIMDRVIDAMKKKYDKLINASLKNKTIALLSIVGMFIGSIFLFNFITVLFFPESVRSLVTVDVKLPQGTRIDATLNVVEGIEQFLEDELKIDAESSSQGVVNWSSFIGRGPASYDLGYLPDEPNPNYAHMLVNTSSGAANSYVIARLDSFVYQNFPTANIKVKRLSAGGGSGGTPIEVKVSGNDPKELTNIAVTVKNKLAEQYGTKNIEDDWGTKTKKVVLNIDPLKTQNAGLSNQDIAISLRTALSGFDIGTYREGKENISIVMRDFNHDKLSLQNLESINIYAQRTGANVPLSQVADIDVVWEHASIFRKDLKRSVKVSSNITEDGNTATIMGEMVPWLDEQMATEWPEGYSYVLGGDDDMQKSAMGNVIVWLPLSGFIIVMLLIIQFNSFRKTLIILMTIPLGIIGVSVGLLVLGSYLGFFAFLGVISLAGIIINNAIVLLDRIEVEQNRGLPSIEAIREACLQRFRPIMLTTFTTVLGMIPLYMGGGIMWEPLAAAIMIGLLFGTIVTLVFVPVCYSVLYRD